MGYEMTNGDNKWHQANHQSACIKAEQWADDHNISSDHVRNLARAYLDLSDGVHITQGDLLAWIREYKA